MDDAAPGDPPRPRQEQCQVWRICTRTGQIRGSGSTVRIIAGTAKSVALTYPGGAHIRPTTDAVRESLFGSLVEDVPGSRFADLYAGCGSVGIEALSRGASHCVFVERAHACVTALAGNLDKTHTQDRANVVRGRVERVWSRVCEAQGPFDIVFADPPYDHGGIEMIVSRLVCAWEGVAHGGLVVLQCSVALGEGTLPDPDKRRRFGQTEIRFYRRPS